jgi:ribonuclease VapC
MPGCVLDASALLATLRDEPGGEAVEAWLQGASISAVNLSEVIAKFAEWDTPPEVISATLAELNLDVRPFDRSQAERAGHLRSATRRFGLSLGDRACLALAQELGFPAITTDKAWANLDIGIEIELIR